MKMSFNIAKNYELSLSQKGDNVLDLRSLPSPADLKYFLEVYKVKNISRAAERLGITQPSLSLSLKRLESLLTVKLFARSKSGVEPTQEGDILAKDVEALLIDWCRIGDKAKDANETVKGSVRIGAHSSVAMYAVKPWIKNLSSKYNELDLFFYHDLSRKILEQVVSFKLDIGLVINPVEHPDLVIKVLTQDEVTLRKAMVKNVDTSTLIYDPALIQVQSLLNSLKKKKITFSRHLTSSNLEFVEHLTSLGVGVGVLPSKVCKSKTEIFEPSLKPFKDELCLVYRADLPKTKSFEVVIEEIKGAFMS